MRKRTLLYALVALLVVGLNACNDNDEPSKGGKNIRVIGTWKAVNILDAEGSVEDYFLDDNAKGIVQYVVIEKNSAGNLQLTSYEYQCNVRLYDDEENVIEATVEAQDDSNGSLIMRYGPYSMTYDYKLSTNEDGTDLMTLDLAGDRSTEMMRVSGLPGEAKGKVSDDIDLNEAMSLFSGFWENRESGEGLTLNMVLTPDSDLFMVLTSGCQVGEIKYGKFTPKGSGSGYASGDFYINGESALAYRFINTDELEIDGTVLHRRTFGVGSYARYSAGEDEPAAVDYRSTTSYVQKNRWDNGNYSNYFAFFADHDKRLDVTVDVDMLSQQIDMTSSTSWRIYYQDGADDGYIQAGESGELLAVQLDGSETLPWYLVVISDLSEDGSSYFSGWYIGQFRDWDYDLPAKL